jgi:uncharacterized surface protein with fasciclin (FAS1) repeats
LEYHAADWFTLWAVVQQQANLNLGSFNALVQATGLFTQLDDPNAQFTVFAPTDDAFIRTLATLNNVDLQVRRLFFCGNITNCCWSL